MALVTVSEKPVCSVFSLSTQATPPCPPEYTANTFLPPQNAVDTGPKEKQELMMLFYFSTTILTLPTVSTAGEKPSEPIL